MKRMGFYPRLALQSMMKNRALYLPYLLMGMLMAAVFYIMSYLNTPAVLKAMERGGTTQTVLGLGMVIISLFSGSFLWYCSAFLTGRRMKEFGLYNVLGMGKGNIAHIMLWDTLLTLLIVLGGGLLAGASLARLAELLLIRILNAELATNISLYAPGLWRTAEVFGGIYGFILLVNLLRLRIANPMELLRAESAGERPPKANWLMAILGLALLGAGYGLAVTIKSPLTALMLFFAAVLLVIAGTYLLFIAGSVALCRLLQRNKRYYYQAHHFISLSSMAFRMKRNGAGLATICILCTMVLIIFASTICLYAGVDDTIAIVCPRDIVAFVTVETPEPLSEEKLAASQETFLAAARKGGAEPQNTVLLRTLAGLGVVSGGDFQAIPMTSLDTRQLEITIYPLSLYEELTGEKVDLADNELMYYPFKEDVGMDTLSLFGSAPFALRRVEEVPSLLLVPNYSSAVGCVMLFAEDFDGLARDVLSRDAGVQDGYYLFFDTGLPLDELDKVTWHLFDQLGTARNLIRPAGAFSAAMSIRDSASFPQELYGLYGGFFFLGLLLGGVFSVAAVTIIYYKQISEGYEDAGRFAVMRQVGLDDGQIHRSINSQVLTVFFALLLLAGVHALFAMPMVLLLLRSLGMHNAPLFYGVSALSMAFFALLYAAVYFVTARACYRIVR